MESYGTSTLRLLILSCLATITMSYDHRKLYGTWNLVQMYGMTDEARKCSTLKLSKPSKSSIQSLKSQCRCRYLNHRIVFFDYEIHVWRLKGGFHVNHESDHEISPCGSFIFNSFDEVFDSILPLTSSRSCMLNCAMPFFLLQPFLDDYLFVHHLPYPDVPVVMLYARHLPTEKQLESLNKSIYGVGKGHVMCTKAMKRKYMPTPYIPPWWKANQNESKSFRL